MDYHHLIQHCKNVATIARHEPEAPEFDDRFVERPARCGVCRHLFFKDDLRIVDGMMMCEDCERIEP
jgi:formylmethanofuran dehydrogenase subunit E